MISVCLYLFLFFLSARLLSNYHKNSNFCIGIGLLIPIIFAAGRYYVGTDFVSYVYMFDRRAGIPWNRFWESSSNSPLFFLICKVTYSIGGRVLTFGVIAALTVVITYRTLKKYYPDIALGTSIVVFLFSYFSNSLNVSRQYIAVAIIFYGLQYIFDDKLIKYLICVAVAMMFHNSAAIAIIMWFLWNHGKHCAVIGKKRFFIVVIVLIAVLGYQNIIILVSSKISFFSRFLAYINPYTYNINNRDFYLSLFRIMIIFIISKKLKSKDERVDFMITMMEMSLLIGITGFWEPHIKRVAFYFEMPATLVLCGYMPACVKEKQKVLMSALVIFYVVAKFILVAYILRQGDLIPYTFDLTTDFFATIM